MSNKLSLNWPSALQTPEEQTEAIQKAFADTQKTVNANATEPSVLIHLPTVTMTTQQTATSGTYANIPGWSWTLNSAGGLVMIDVIMAGVAPAATSAVALLIDGKIVLEQTTTTAEGAFCAPFHWGAVLGKGQHTISFQYKNNGVGDIVVNGTSFGPNISSTVGIIEFPANIQNVNVSAK